MHDDPSQHDTPRPSEALRTRLDAVLVGHAVDSLEDQGLHSWRCRYPDTYGGGPCHCYADLLDALVAAVEQPEPARRERRRRVDGCATCARDGRHGPSHDASERCESGGHPHCSCDTCF